MSTQRPNKSLQPTPGSASRSAARLTSLGPAWLSSDRWTAALLAKSITLDEVQ